MSEKKEFEPEDFGEIVDEPGIDFESENPEEIRRKLEVLEDELENLSEAEWDYAKRLLKHGLAAWVLGLSIFILSLISFQGPEIMWGAPPLTFSLLIMAGAAPVIFISYFIQRDRKEVTNLSKIRSELLNNYETMLLKKMEKDAS